MATRGAQPRQACGVVVPFPKRRAEPEPFPGRIPANAPRYSRRLSDRILIAFHVACDGGELAIAELLLRCCETAMTRRSAEGHNRREDDERLIAAFERLWFLRHPDAPDGPPDEEPSPGGPGITS